MRKIEMILTAAVRETRGEISLDLRTVLNSWQDWTTYPRIIGRSWNCVSLRSYFIAPSTISLSDLVMDEREIAAACFVPIDAINPSVVHYSSIEKDYAF